MKTWEHLFDGELSDAPGRCESWTEELCYLGKNKWLLRSIGTDFSGTKEGETFQEEMDTNALLERIIEFDGYDLESSRSAPYFDIEQTQVIGDRTIRFRELAEKYKLKDCVDRINVIEKERAEDLREPTEDEIIELEKWDEKKKAILAPFQEIINRWTSYIIGEAGTGQAAGIIWYIKKGTVSRYISNYVFENGKLPIGKHLIDINTSNYTNHDFEVDFDEVVLKAKS
jgi:hypothetical protein